MIQYPEPCVGALIFSKGKILLVLSWKWGEKWSLPGGHINLRETLEEALKREVREDVGLEIEVQGLINVQEAILSKEFYRPKHFIFLDFLCKATTLGLRPDGREVQKIVWATPQKALTMDIDSFTRSAIETYLKAKKKGKRRK